jgi:septal ring factor EnvC (AmiA/AmiB activator)
MPSQVLFNSLAYIDRLTRGGFSPEQARASAEALDSAFSEGVATKSDIRELEHRFSSEIEVFKRETASSFESVKHEISSLKHDVSEVKRDVAESESRLRLEFKRDLADIRLEIAQSKNETLRWMFGFVIVLIGAIFAIVKFVR